MVDSSLNNLHYKRRFIAFEDLAHYYDVYEKRAKAERYLKNNPKSAF